MSMPTNKKSVMTLYSSSDDLFSHRTRIVLAEKGVSVEVFELKDGKLTEDLLEMNPYGTVPTLIDRSLTLYESRIIMEYLDERFPHPPLLPVYPVAKAEFRLMMFRIEKDWYSLVDKIKLSKSTKDQDQARKDLLDSLLSIAPVFKEHNYFLNDEFSLLDCSLAPMLWRLPTYKIEIPKSEKQFHEYMEKVFERKTFQKSLTETERELVKPLKEEA